MVRVDHVVYGVADLAAAAGRLADLGLPSVEGGRHPQWGTENRIVGLGDCYLELLAGPPVTALLEGEDDRILGWMVRTEDIGADARRLGLEVLPMSRERPDGTELRWRLAGFGLGGPMPVFIQWDTPWEPGGDGRLTRLDVPCEAGRLREWVGGATLPAVRCIGDSGGFAAEITTAVGRSLDLR
jgi:hypothetical protein